MTKFKNRWKSKEQEYFIILRKLARGATLIRPDFEAKIDKVNELAQKLPDKIPDSIPHSSVIKCLTELTESGFICEVKTGKKSKKGCPIMGYCITPFGFIRLLSLYKGKSILFDVMENLQLFFNPLWEELSFLKHAFTRAELFDALVSVCKNTTLGVDFDPRRRSKTTLIPILIPYPASLELEKIKWAHIYYIGINLMNTRFSHTIMDWTILSGKSKKEKYMENDMFKIMKMTSRMINGAFIHELFMRSYGFSRSGFVYGQNHLGFLINRLKLNTLLFDDYMMFLQKIESSYLQETKLMNRIKSSLTQMH